MCIYFKELDSSVIQLEKDVSNVLAELETEKVLNSTFASEMQQLQAKVVSARNQIDWLTR